MAALLLAFHIVAVAYSATPFPIVETDNLWAVVVSSAYYATATIF